jgi:hypothetical protein
MATKAAPAAGPKRTVLCRLSWLRSAPQAVVVLRRPTGSEIADSCMRANESQLLPGGEGGRSSLLTGWQAMAACHGRAPLEIGWNSYFRVHPKCKFLW